MAINEALEKNKGQFVNREIASRAGKKSGEVRRQKKSITSSLLALLNKDYEARDDDGEKVKLSGWELAAATLFSKAIKEKNLGALNDLYDRIEGKPKQFIQVSGNEDIFDDEEMQKIKGEIGIEEEVDEAKDPSTVTSE